MRHIIIAKTTINIVQALCILSNIADGDTAKRLIVDNEDMLKKLTSYMVNDAHLCALILPGLNSCVNCEMNQATKSCTSAIATLEVKEKKRARGKENQREREPEGRKIKENES